MSLDNADTVIDGPFKPFFGLSGTAMLETVTKLVHLPAPTSARTNFREASLASLACEQGRQRLASRCRSKSEQPLSRIRQGGRVRCSLIHEQGQFEIYFLPEASSPYRIAASSRGRFISFSFLNLMQYPVTLAFPSVFPYVPARYVLSSMPRI